MLLMFFANWYQTWIVNNTACWLESTLGCGAVWLWGWHAHSSTLHGWESQAIDLSSIIQATRQGNSTEMFFMLVAAAVHWKWMESFNLILVWSQFYSFPLRVGGLDPCITHSFKNHRNHSNLASNFTDIRTSFMFFPKIWACRWRPSFLLDSFDSGNLSEQVE